MDAMSTKHLHITFYSEAVENPAKTREAGRPIFDERELVRIKFVGDQKRELVAPANEKCVKDPATQEWVSYAQLYHRHYDAFKSGQAAVGEGTPISELPFLTEARRAELRALHIHTAEALAQLEGSNLSRLGMFGRELKDKAQAYLDRAKETALETRLASENATLKARLEALEAQLLQGRNGNREIVQPAADTAEQPDDSETPADPSVFGNWDDKALRAFIKDRTGAAPKGNPSHETLVRLADDANAKEAA